MQSERRPRHHRNDLCRLCLPCRRREVHSTSADRSTSPPLRLATQTSTLSDLLTIQPFPRIYFSAAGSQVPCNYVYLSLGYQPELESEIDRKTLPDVPEENQHPSADRAPFVRQLAGKHSILAHRASGRQKRPISGIQTAHSCHSSTECRPIVRQECSGSLERDLLFYGLRRVRRLVEYLTNSSKTAFRLFKYGCGH